MTPSLLDAAARGASPRLGGLGAKEWAAPNTRHLDRHLSRLGA